MSAPGSARTTTPDHDPLARTRRAAAPPRRGAVVPRPDAAS